MKRARTPEALLKHDGAARLLYFWVGAEVAELDNQVFVMPSTLETHHRPCPRSERDLTKCQAHNARIRRSLKPLPKAGNCLDCGMRLISDIECFAPRSTIPSTCACATLTPMIICFSNLVAPPRLQDMEHTFGGKYRQEACTANLATWSPGHTPKLSGLWSIWSMTDSYANGRYDQRAPI